MFYIVTLILSSVKCNHRCYFLVLKPSAVMTVWLACKIYRSAELGSVTEVSDAGHKTGNLWIVWSQARGFRYNAGCRTIDGCGFIPANVCPVIMLLAKRGCHSVHFFTIWSDIKFMVRWFSLLSYSNNPLYFTVLPKSCFVLLLYFQCN